LEGLKDHLLKPELVAAFIEGFQAEMARARESERAQRAKAAKKRMEIDRKIGALVRAIEDGMYEPSMKDRMQVTCLRVFGPLINWETGLLSLPPSLDHPR
jgi:hypothetical protein